MRNNVQDSEKNVSEERLKGEVGVKHWGRGVKRRAGVDINNSFTGTRMYLGK